MGFLDEAKDKLHQAKEKIEHLIDGHEDQADQAVDKAADVADDKTGGEHTEQIDAAADQTKDALGIDTPPGEVRPPAPAAPAEPAAPADPAAPSS
jgi:MT0933-like antitoxin protein